MTEYFVILAVQKSLGPGIVELRTVKCVASVGSSATRAEIFSQTLKRLPAVWRDAMVLFFSAEPNALKGAAS